MTKANVEIEWGNIELPGLSDDELFNTNWNKVAAMRELAERESWKQKRQELGAEYKNNAALKEKHKKRNQDQLNDPIWREKYLKGIERRDADPNIKKINEEAAKKRMKNANFIDCNKNKKKMIMTPAGPFNSRHEAALHFNTLPQNISKWVKSKPDEFYYIKS